jgi:hypothetical protein
MPLLVFLKATGLLRNDLLYTKSNSMLTCFTSLSTVKTSGFIHLPVSAQEKGKMAGGRRCFSNYVCVENCIVDLHSGIKDQR